MHVAFRVFAWVFLQVRRKTSPAAKNVTKSRFSTRTNTVLNDDKTAALDFGNNRCIFFCSDAIVFYTSKSEIP